MQIRFKMLSYQQDAVQAVVDCFKGQLPSDGDRYRMNIGQRNAIQQTDLFTPPLNVENHLNRENHLDIENHQSTALALSTDTVENEEIGFENASIFNIDAVLKNIQQVQIQNALPPSSQLVLDDQGKGKNLTNSAVNLNIEMETGTGKTYCYIRTMFELHKHYGWSKFIIVVPSIAIREGVYQSLTQMTEHFQEQYGKKARFFIYDSKALHHLESFSANAGIHIMIINVQAFNATGKDHRRIYDELDEFQSRRPIDVIRRNRPILILDEPQKMGAEKTLQSLANFNPLFILRYSATHKRHYNLVYRLDALDAYNQKLVKKITVKGIEVQGLTGTHGYLYLQDIVVSESAPVARLELEIATKTGFKREIRKVRQGDHLYEISKHAQQYHDRYIVADIDARNNTVRFLNGKTIRVGEAFGHVDETVMRTLQIRETIRAHLQKERQLFQQGIKVLSLFFIDEVAKYRQYDENNQPVAGEYIQIFKTQYQEVLNEYMQHTHLEHDPYMDYLKSIDVDRTHNGYFSIDKKSKRWIDPTTKPSKDEETGLKVQYADDIDAYDLILKDKERLLSFEEPTRFIFSHSALREGWDNPNVFVICTLKHSDNVISRRQEVGRGLRLAVNKNGERMDANYFQGAWGEIHKLNNLTVVTNESYKDFVENLQSEILSNIANRATQATPDYFKGKIFKLNDGSTFEITELMAKQINKYLFKHDYIDDNDHLTSTYHHAKAQHTLARLPDHLLEYSQQIFQLVDGLFDHTVLADFTEDANKKLSNPINQNNLAKKEFQALWAKINRKAMYQVHIDTERLIQDSILAIERIAQERNHQFVERLSYKLSEATQKDQASYTQVEAKNMFGQVTSHTEIAHISVASQVKYDLIGEIATHTDLTRRTVATILAGDQTGHISGINASIFAQYKLNPEAFIREICRIINAQQAKMVIQGLSYQPLQHSYASNEIFISNDYISLQSYKAERHVWDYVVTDSDQERRFVEALDGANEVIVYAKLPERFQIPTPFGAHHPDWAIAFSQHQVRQIYFVAETKGSIHDADLREIEKHKIESAKKFFATLNHETMANQQVQYAVIEDFSRLMQLVK